ncbi:hypothetical protein LCGC14_0996860 [marine sediment metagenome]|uniref:Uncharacterized protein n=1 Tax=marine sediment metagenome TaxID=412755 RepID=A0A0F9NQQ5_9ZZZZ
MRDEQQEPGGLPGPGEPTSASEPASEASGDDKVEARAVSPVLDDPRSIEEGPQTRRVRLGLLTTDYIEDLRDAGKIIEVDPDGGAYQIVELPRDHAAGRSQRGVPRLEEKDKPEVALPVDHAGDIPQAGSPADPDPLTIHGFRMAKIAAVAFGAVQLYKWSLLKQQPRIWDSLTPEERKQITEAVRPLLSGGDFSPTAMHEVWARDRREAGVTVEQDPRVGLPWGDLDETERRKGFIFAQVCIALTRDV